MCWLQRKDFVYHPVSRFWRKDRHTHTRAVHSWNRVYCSDFVFWVVAQLLTKQLHYCMLKLVWWFDDTDCLQSNHTLNANKKEWLPVLLLSQCCVAEALWCVVCLIFSSKLQDMQELFYFLPWHSGTRKLLYGYLVLPILCQQRTQPCLNHSLNNLGFWCRFQRQHFAVVESCNDEVVESDISMGLASAVDDFLKFEYLI